MVERIQATKLALHHPTAFIHSNAVRPHKRYRRRLGFDYPVSFYGATEHFKVYFEPSLGIDGETIAYGLLDTSEGDYETIAGYFGGDIILKRRLPLNIIIAALPEPPNKKPMREGTGGAYHWGCKAVDIYVDAHTRPSLNIDNTRMLLAAEVVEVFSHAQSRGWDCSHSNGEGLSRVLSASLYPNELDGYRTAAFWLDSDRRDFVNTNFNTDRNKFANGCSVLFLNWLHYQMNFSWKQIVGSAASTLGKTFARLTESTKNSFLQFKNILADNFPTYVPSRLMNDNPFPLTRV